MLIAVVTDIHGNRPAFEAVLAAVGEAGADELWCLGDLVGYGAEPDACVQLAAEHADVCLAGNHDLGVLGSISIEDFSTGARLAAEWTATTITDATRDYLGALPSAGERHGVGLFHASPRDPVWEYVLDTATAQACLDVATLAVNLIGHSHVALSFDRSGGQPVSGAPRGEGDAVELAGREWLVNPGAVGQPRDGDPRAAWLLLDQDAGTARWCREAYDVAAAQRAIREARLPDVLAERLQYGQ